MKKQKYAEILDILITYVIIFITQL